MNELVYILEEAKKHYELFHMWFETYQDAQANDEKHADNLWACPRQNIYMPMYAGDEVTGIIAFLPSGSIIARSTTRSIDAGGGFNIGAVDYLPYGKQ